MFLPRSAIEWGYKNLTEGQNGPTHCRILLHYQDNRIKNLYVRTPKQRYDNITGVFPNIHHRVPQHLIASYLGITSVHLSRLKKAAIEKHKHLLSFNKEPLPTFAIKKIGYGTVTHFQFFLPFIDKVLFTDRKTYCTCTRH
ncbi:MAG: hypothetical protein R2822_10910 [Spirosomataceae bacterium]